METHTGLLPSIERLSVKLFADGADKEGIVSLSNNPRIRGFTTNPSLLREAGVSDYGAFAHEILPRVAPRPVSFEVLADDIDTMEKEARIVATWGENVYVKIPVIDIAGVPTAPLISRLSRDGIRVNVTAVFTPEQAKSAADALSPLTPSIISVFAGRIADTGRDPMPIMREIRDMLAPTPSIELLWASTRELYNIIEANEVGAHIITVPHGILGKLANMGKPLEQCATDTVATFSNDAKAAGYIIS